ncbi:MAG: lipoyl domain-containing protein [Nannocystales bacterium]
MSAPTVILFDLGDEHTSGTITQWFVSEGDQVRSGQRLVEVEADKAVVEILATADGVLLKTSKGPGEDLTRGDELGWIGHEPAPSASVEQVEQVLRLRVHASCPACGGTVAINGPWIDATCTRCGFHADLDPQWWAGAFEVAVRGAGFTRMSSGPWRLLVHGEQGESCCHNCDAALPLSAQSPMHSVHCGRCGLSHRAGPAPAWLGAHDPTIVRVVGDLPPATAPRANACQHCATPVHPDTHVSVPRCTQCGRDVIATSSPPPIARTWAVIRSPLRGNRRAARS